MQKFKIGDKVKVVDEEAMLAFSVPDYAPRTGIISEVLNDAENGSAIRFEGDVWWYPEKCLAFDRKFDPKPGDTIVCRGGSRWTACAVEDYKYRSYHPHAVITTEIKGPYENHMNWNNFDGAAGNSTFDIIEVIPAPVPVVPELKTYTVREVLEAHREYNGYSSGVSDVTVKAVQKILDRRNDPDYATYLELKARFEN